MKTLREMLSEARREVREETPEQLKARLAGGEPPVVIDVRDPDEYRDGYIDPAVNISRGFLEFRIATVAIDPNTPIVLYCQTGLRSLLAGKVLRDLGFVNVTSLAGGYQRWRQMGFPAVKAEPFTQDQGQRYSRHFLLPPLV